MTTKVKYTICILASGSYDKVLTNVLYGHLDFVEPPQNVGLQILYLTPVLIMELNCKQQF